MPYKKYICRQEYLEKAIPEGFHKKLLILDGEVVGQIEYAPAEVSGYPITGKNVIVMNCIWVLRRVKGHNFGKLLINDMVTDEKSAAGFATIALENHWSHWFEKWQMEKLGFQSVDSIKISHRAKHKERILSVHTIWMSVKKNARPPT
jgi:N-acetylglutamate synthase-like GNAT family acetyltransferase